MAQELRLASWSQSSMTNRQRDLHTHARRLGFRVRVGRGNPTFDSDLVNEVWEKLRGNMAQTEGPENRRALQWIIDDFGAKLWGDERDHLLAAGLHKDYPRDLHWPEDRSRIINICRHMRLDTSTQQALGDLSEAPLSNEDEGNALERPVRSTLTNTTQKSPSDRPRPSKYMRIDQKDAESGNVGTKDDATLKLIDLWLFSLTEDIHGTATLYGHRSTADFFSAIRREMSSGNPEVLKGKTVQKIKISFPFSMREADRILTKDSDGRALSGLRTRLANQFGKCPNASLGERVQCFVEVFFEELEDQYDVGHVDDV